MLNPDDRQTLLDALRPPPGYGLGCAVGTTFSLHLDCALTPPAAFALYAVADQERSAALEALELLEAIRRHAGRFTIFFQAGQVVVPPQRRLFAFLEESVVPVRAPGRGVFHPKVWVLRFDAPHAPSVFRALVASRNLTYDRSWDAILRLDSTSESAVDVPLVDGAALAQFVAALPGLAEPPLAEERQADIARLASALREVRWAAPPGMTGGRFHVFGLGEEVAALPFPETAEHMAIISPFLSGGLLHRLPRVAGRSVIVSRPDELRANGTVVSRVFREAWVLDPDAMPAVLEVPEAVRGGTPGDPAVALEGLHAKVYVFDRGDQSTILAGSANATRAAFADNVEVLAELQGSTRLFGVEALLAEPGQERQTLRSFLMPFAVEPEDLAEAPPPEQAVLDALRRDIAGTGWEARARMTDDGERYTLEFAPQRSLPQLPPGLAWHAWPVTLPRELGKAVDAGAMPVADFVVSLEGISAFLANELVLGDCSTTFVLTTRLVEAPSNRATRLLGLMLGDASRLLRYLLMLLSDDAFSGYDLANLVDATDGITGSWRNRPDELPLLEVLLRTLATEPARLAHVERLIEDLQAEPACRDLLPPGLLEMWAPIRDAARGLPR
ncbi:MAG: phospholipase D family protein [Gammaproteobacteria bacterium]